MSKLLRLLEQACAELNLVAKFNKEISIGEKVFTPVAHIASLGSSKGTVILSNVDPMRSSKDLLVSEGYAYSIMYEPRSDEPLDLESFKETFADWGWSGDPCKKPSWMNVSG